MRRKRVLVVAGLVVGVPLLLLAAALAYLAAADLGTYRPSVEQALTNALGREVRIGGEFEPRIALTSSLVAGDVSLANPAWSPAPHMITADRISVRLRLLSLLFGPLRIEEVECNGVRVALEVDAEGRPNWMSESARDSDHPRPASPGVTVGRLLIEDAELTYRDRSEERPWTLAVAKLELASDESGMQEFELDGFIDGTPLELSGRLGPQAGLLASGSIEADLSGKLGDTVLAIRGRTGSLATLVDTEVSAAVEGPDLTAFAEMLGLPHLGEGPFRVTAEVLPVDGRYDLALLASVGEIAFDARGRADSLLQPRGLDVSIEASGPNAAAVGALAGIETLPAESFSFSGRLHWEGFPISFEEVELRVGENHLMADGVLGALPLMGGTDFRFEGAGPNAAALGALARLDLPAEPFEMRGRLARKKKGIAVERLEARIGAASLDADGVLGDPPGYTDSDLHIRVAGPDLSHFGSLARRPLPAEAFEVEGRLERGERKLALRDAQARLGQHVLSFEGRLGLVRGLAGTELRLAADGPDLSLPSELGGLAGLPPEPYRVRGGLRVRADGLLLDDVAGTLGDRSVWADGRLSLGARLTGTELHIRLEGEDLSRTAPLLGFADAPAVAYRAAGRLRIDETAYLLDAVTARAGDVELEAGGRVGAGAGLEGTDLHVTARGPRAAALDPWIGRALFPDVPFEVSGGLRIRDRMHQLDDVVAVLGPDRLAATGSLAAVEDLAGTDLSFELSGPSLARLGQLAVAAGLAKLPDLPDKAYSATGRVKVSADGYDLVSTRIDVGAASSRLDGRLGRPPAFSGSDLQFEFDGPDAAVFLALSGVTVPVVPFQGRGRFERPSTGFRFHGVSVRLGDYRAWVDGALGEPPELVGTDLDLRAEGPSLELIRQLASLPKLPDEPFEFSTHLVGTPREFTVERLEARLGESDLSGSLQADLSGKPVVHAELQSRRLDVVTLLGLGEPASEPVEEQAPGAGAAPPAGASPKKTEPRRFLSDEPFDVSPLQAVNGTVRWSIGGVPLRGLQLEDVRVDAALQDGHLRLDPVVASGEHGGSLEAVLDLHPEDEKLHVETRIGVRGARVKLSAGEEDPARWPPVDVDVVFAGSGGSAHGLAVDATGRIILAAGDGAVDRSVLDLLATPVFRAFREALLPFSKANPSSHLECAVLLVNFDDGRARLDPLVARTDAMTVLAHGRVDLTTEEIDFQWIVKQRKGIGLGASTITNPYIKLGGTLSRPSVEVKPLRAATATGAAVATGGLSLLGKGFWDRITAERNVCERALRELARSAGEKTASTADGP